VNYGYPYLIHELLKQLRIDEVLDKVLKEPAATRVKAMTVGKIIIGSSKLVIYNRLKRESFVCKLLGIDTRIESGQPVQFVGIVKLQSQEIRKEMVPLS
jgi:hypothetical protein